MLFGTSYSAAIQCVGRLFFFRLIPGTCKNFFGLFMILLQKQMHNITCSEALLLFT